MRKVLYLFGQMLDEDIDWLASAGELLVVDDGTVLIRQGREIDSFYVLVEGAFAVTVASIGEIARLAVGEVVGEMSFVSSTLPNATVSAVGTCKVFRISRKVLTDRLRSDQGFAARFYYALALFLADRLRGTVERLGYGRRTEPEPDLSDDDLNEVVLDRVSMAGMHFDRFLRLVARG